MGTTSMQLDSKLRDELAEIAEKDFDGVPLGEAVRRLVMEHKINRIMERYAELRADPQEWASYQAELAEWGRTAGDGLPDARDEYPEQNT
jgi:hypothetical protein